MKKAKRIGAIILAIFLIGLYVTTLISAMFATPATSALFNACLFSTVAIPMVIFAYTLIYKMLKDKNKEQNDKNL